MILLLLNYRDKKNNIFQLFVGRTKSSSIGKLSFQLQIFSSSFEIHHKIYGLSKGCIPLICISPKLRHAGLNMTEV